MKRSLWPQNFYDFFIALPRRIIESSKLQAAKMLILVFAMLIPVVALVPTITRAFSNISSDYSIQRREAFLLPFEMMFFGLIARRFEHESFWKLIIIGFVTSLWASLIISYYPPFD